MKIYRFLDTETTGLDKERDKIVEIAWVDTVLFERKFMPVSSFSSLIAREEPITYNPTVPNKIPEKVTKLGIDEGDLVEEWNKVEDFTIIAYNAKFDVGMLKNIKGFIRINDVFDAYSEIPWVKKASLIHQCADHGILIHGAHSAMNDTIALINLMNVQKVLPLEGFEEYAKLPNCFYIATVTFDGRETAKEKGYQWMPTLKYWIKKTKGELKEKEHWEVLSKKESFIKLVEELL